MSTARKPAKPKAAAKPARAAKPSSKATAKSARRTTAAKPTASVEAFMAALRHPRKDEIEAVRRIILGADPAIQEEVKWNAPSFRAAHDFATLNVRGKGSQERVWLILHTGVKARRLPTDRINAADPGGMLRWLAQNRAMITLDGMDDIRTKQQALAAIVRAWIS